MRKRLVARFLELARERVERLNNDLVALEQRSDDAELGARLLRELHTIKGEARMTGFQAISDHAHALEDLLSSAREPGWHPDSVVMERALAGLDQIVALVNEAQQPATAADAPNAAPLVTPSAVLRVSAAKLERQSEHIADLLLAQARDDRALARLQDRVHASTTTLQGARDLLRQLRLDRGVDHRRLLGLDQSLEALALLGRQVRDAVTDLSDSSFDRRSLLAALDDDVRDLRLMPISQLFAEYPRAIRDLAATQGKDVRVEARGGDVEVDKQVVDLIAEPLLHILRNAVDHGVEPPAVRAAARKAPQAVLILAARQAGQQVEISVTDDGPGLNYEAIRARAVASGLLNAEEARSMSPTRLTELIFRPGFTTREGVTDLSGRGVGLEVVRERIAAAQGHTRAQSWPGSGTRFVITVPTSTVLAQALLVTVGDQIFALPSESVLAALTIPAAERISDGGDELRIAWDENELPLADIGLLLGGAPVVRPGEPIAAIVVQTLHQRRALAVTTVIGEQRVVHRPLDRLAATVPSVQGCVVLADGALALVLSVRHALDQLVVSPVRRADVASKKKPRVLVVEDSLLTRDLLRDTLTLGGFEILEAANGAEGLALLETNTFDLVLTDLDMPVMDGLTFIAAVRAHPRTAALPIAVFSTRAGPLDRAAVSRAGATEYLPKAQFREADLIRRLHALLAPEQAAG